MDGRTGVSNDIPLTIATLCAALRAFFFLCDAWACGCACVPTAHLSSRNPPPPTYQRATRQTWGLAQSRAALAHLSFCAHTRYHRARAAPHGACCHSAAWLHLSARKISLYQAVAKAYCWNKIFAETYNIIFIYQLFISEHSSFFNIW